MDSDKKSKNIILSNEEIQHKINRIAYQVYESNLEEKEIIIAGIVPNGFTLAKRISKILEDISGAKITLCEVKMDAINLTNVVTSIDSDIYENKSLVLIDDVLNSGKTLIYGIRHFLSSSLKQFKTVVLINRNHKKYPVKADFKGLSLSTSMNEHVRVVLKGQGTDFAFLE